MKYGFSFYREQLESIRDHILDNEKDLFENFFHKKECVCESCAEDFNLVEARKPKGGKYMPSSKAKPGQGGRFKALTKKLQKQGKSKDSAKAIAASIGRAKFGKTKFQKMASAGKRHESLDDMSPYQPEDYRFKFNKMLNDEDIDSHEQMLNDPKTNSYDRSRLMDNLAVIARNIKMGTSAHGPEQRERIKDIIRSVHGKDLPHSYPKSHSDQSEE